MISHLKNWVVCFLLALAASAGGFVHGASVTLTPEKTVIVVAKNGDKNEQDAAKLLQTWLRKASANTSGFDIKDDTDTSFWAGKVALAIGRTALAKPDDRLEKMLKDSFIIHGNSSVISIAGATSNGTYYGAVSFLDRSAGVRFYMPGELWTSLPANHQVAFDGEDFVSQPFVDSGYITGVSTKPLGDEDWLRRIGGLRRKGGTHQHDLWTIFPPEKYAAAHPEIYPIYNGQRYIPTSANDQSWQVDFAEPATLEVAKESVASYFQVNPMAEYIAVSVNDSNHWSESERNQQIIAGFKAQNPQGNYTLAATSDIYWRFMNQLAAWMQKTYPDKMLVGIAYLSTSGAPSFPLQENIVAFAVFHIGELQAYDKPINGTPSLLDQWLAVARHFGNHDWYEGDGYLFPRIYSDKWSRFLHELQARESFVYMHAEAYPNWGFDGPKYYVLAKMWWDPQADPRALTRQFCDDMFGPAAAPMYAYFTQLETLWTQLNEVEGPKRKLDLWSTQFKTTLASRSTLLHCQDMLAQAAGLAITNEQKARIALFAKCFAFSESLFALAEQPANVTLHQHAVDLAGELAKDKWTVYNPAKLQAAIQAISKPTGKK